jgi:peptidoglycan/LPS O-acetylase OafA/YrhL
VATANAESRLDLGYRLSTPSENAMTLVRLLLALAVIVGHSFEMLYFEQTTGKWWFFGSGIFLGTFAVNCFFAISGYVILESWVRTPNAMAFFSSRFLRIFPGFWMCLLLTVCVFGALMVYHRGLSLSGYFADPTTWSYVWKNITLHTQQTELYGLSAHMHPNGHFNGSLWTLIWEFLCYLGVMVAGLTLFRFSRRWAVVALFAAFYSNLNLDPTHVRFFAVLYVNEATVANPAFFCGGALVYVLIHDFKVNLDRAWIIAAALLLSAFALSFSNATYTWLAPLALPVAILLVCGKLRTPGWLKHDYSYGTYLYGMPVQRVLFDLFPAFGAGLVSLLSAMLALLCGALSWIYVERPAQRLKRFFSPRATSGPAS